jgi:hypothetical protein
MKNGKYVKKERTFSSDLQRLYPNLDPARQLNADPQSLVITVFVRISDMARISASFGLF